MSRLIAIDVAVLLPSPVADTAVALSASLPAAESQGLTLDATHLPHITLTQQFVPATKLPDVTRAVAAIIEGRPPLRLRVTGPGGGARSVWMEIARTAELLDVHRRLMDALHPFERRGGSAAAFAGGDPRPGDLKWVSGFRSTSSFERYTPHITLGHASIPPHIQPHDFVADLIAVCHLGRFCSCRDVLQSWTLTGAWLRKSNRDS